jgi:hypothetical protein
VPQLGYRKVIELATVGVEWTGDREDVVTKAVNQQNDVVGQCHNFMTGGTGKAEALRCTVH